MEAFDRRVLRFDSGLWPLRVLKFDGAFAPKVLRFDGPAGRGLWYRRFAAMSMYATFGGIAAGGSENHTTGPAARWKCTPSAYGTSPGGGGLLSAELLNS